MRDEHGPIDIQTPDYGPEWWAAAGEFCRCQHHVDTHRQEHLGTPRYRARQCLMLGCNCAEFNGQAHAT